MSAKKYAIVGRMEGLWPHQLPRFEMHRHRRGGDLGHVKRERKYKCLVGTENWAADALARIDEIRYDNYNREIAALEKRKRKKELMTRMVEGPRDPWRDSDHGPMREMILTANKDFFRADLKGFFGEGPSLEQQFETIAIDWLKQTFGDDLVHARADLDETAYHIHAVILPITATKDGRTMVQPSKHAVIADYEHFQDEIGKAFAPLELKRGEERAKEVRKAYAQGKEPPSKRRHVRTREWRQQEDMRLIAEGAAIKAKQAEQERLATEADAALEAERVRLAEQAAVQDALLTMERAAIAAARDQQQQAAATAEAAIQAERDRLARQAAEQDAVLAGADALAAGLIDPAQDVVTLAPAQPDDPAAAQIMARIDKSPSGWRRFAAALAPGWQRMRQAAAQAAEANLDDEKRQVAADRAEVEGVWQKLAAMTRHLLPKDATGQSAREQVARVLARCGSPRIASPFAATPRSATIEAGGRLPLVRPAQGSGGCFPFRTARLHPPSKRTGDRMPILHWLTRDADLRTAAQVPFRLLTEEPALSHGQGEDGLLVQGDNLEALKALLPFYAGRVKCIYIDPPYNTRSAFEHYDDNLEHAQWLGMIVPRLMLLREFLSEDGSIWVSIDDNEGHYLKVVMDEVFGRRNFIDTVIWQKSDSPRNSARQFSSDHDYIIAYGRNSDWLPNRLKRTDEKNAIYRNPDDDPRGPWLPSDPYANKPYSKGQYQITGPTGRTFQPPAGRFWRVSEERLMELNDEGRIWWGPNGDARPSIKRYLTDVQDLVPQTIWSSEAVGSNRTSKNELRALWPGDENFATPKPERLIQRILHIATNPGDLVLDSFLGSGTTAAVAHKMGRRWIGVEMGDHARTHCATRLRKVIEGEGGGISKDVGWQGGGGFRFLTLGPRIYDENGVIAPEVRFADLARHVWFTETRRPLDSVPSTPLLGIVSPPPPTDTPDDGADAPPPAPDRAVALLFNGILKDRSPQGGNVLTRATLALIREDLPSGFAGTLTVYATACRLSSDTLRRERVQFRQTPYDLNAGGL